MKQTSEMVWPVENYTDKIHFALKTMFESRHWLSFTRNQMREHVVNGYSWLKDCNPRQTVLLNQLIVTGIKKLIQQGKVQKVTSKVSVEDQWQWAADVASSGYINVTSEDSVAQTEQAKKALTRRAIGGRSLYKLNNLKPGF